MTEQTIVPPSWIGHRLGLAPPPVRSIGNANIEHSRLHDDAGYTPQQTNRPPQSLKGPIESGRLPGTQALRVVDFTTKLEYRVVLEGESLAQIRRAIPRVPGQSRPGMTPELRELLALAGPPASRIVIGREDTRTRIQPTTVFPYSAIVHLTGSMSSGALIGSNVVLTAAHCVVNGGIRQNSGYTVRWYANEVIPGMDRSPDCRAGSAEEACKLAPFGKFTVRFALVPEGWLSPKGGPQGSGPHFVEHDPGDWSDDIAVLILDEPVNQSAGVFDYDDLEIRQLDNALLLNRGYPAPAPFGIPDGYEPWQMWGDQVYARVLGYLAEVNGIHRIFEHSADTSRGHSGSPLFQWRVSIDQGWRPEIVGIHSHYAQGQNYARRIVQGDLLAHFGLSIGAALVEG